MANVYGKQVVVPLTNKSGGSVAAGDVVVVDTGNDEAFTTSTAGAVTKGVGIAQETIANNASGRVLTQGFASLVNVNASVTRGNYGKTHTVAKQATDAGSSRTVGTFCQFLKAGTTPSAIIYPADLNASSGSVATDAIWDAAGDLAVGTGADTAARLAIGNAGAVLARINGAVAWNAGTSFPTAATNDRYFRTDLGREYYYDGTRWVSTQEYTATYGANAQAANFSGTNVPVPTVGTVYVTTAEIGTYVATTNDSSKYWTGNVYKVATNNTPTAIGTLSTQGDTASQWNRHNSTINAVVDPATHPMFGFDFTKVSTAGNLYVGVTVRYRIVST